MSLPEIIADELEARGWSQDDVLQKFADPIQRLAVDIAMNVSGPNLILDDDTASCLARAFDVDAQFFKNLNAADRAEA